MNEEKNKNSENENKEGPSGFNNYWIYIAIAVVLIGINFIFGSMPDMTSGDLKYPALASALKAQEVEKVLIINNKVLQVYLNDKAKQNPNFKDTFTEGNSLSGKRPNFAFELGSEINILEEVKNIQSEGKVPEGEWVYPEFETKADVIGPIIGWVFPILIIVALWLFIMRRMAGGPGGPGSQIFNIGKSKATLFDSNSKVNVTFENVAGLEEAKEEVMEVVDFLKNPKKYTALGGKIPKGVLLIGSPGTGKTLLAKAVAGEAGVPFFSISGSDFVEMFVGVGASRVRDLFRQAREKAPCIIFIDEIDAIGRARGKSNFTGGNDERENTLNQLLVEMDGFSTDAGVILMAATNRSDVLDGALMRPGRFDRVIGVDRPDLVGREAIFKVHLKNIKIGNDIDPLNLAEMTPGFAGAEIANVCNEAALIAARRNKKAVDMDDFNYALDRVIGGLEKKNKLISPKEKEIIAYHEAGHAICGWFLEHASPLVKVTIVPRGIGTLGYAQYLPKEEFITRKEQLYDRICMTLGGRAAEKIIFDKISTGAQNDLDQITKLAYGMVGIYGMNEKVGNVSFHGMQQDSFQKPYSDETALLIDQEVRKMIDVQYERAQKLLADHREDLEKLAKQLLEKEVLLKSDLERLIGPRPSDIADQEEKNRLARAGGE